jgi:hypothetical protein
MILTGKQIVDLATLAGFTPLHNTHADYDSDVLETEFAIEEFEGKTIAYYAECPDEGVMELG